VNYDVIVVGGGPAGCKAAGLIAGRGFKVLVAEEHERIGEPVQCAGLLSPRTLKAAAVPEEIIINKIHGAYIHSPGGETLTVRGPEEYAYVVDRAVFDRKMSEQARQAGAPQPQLVAEQEESTRCRTIVDRPSVGRTSLRDC